MSQKAWGRDGTRSTGPRCVFVLGLWTASCLPAVSHGLPLGAQHLERGCRKLQFQKVNEKENVPLLTPYRHRTARSTGSSKTLTFCQILQKKRPGLRAAQAGHCMVWPFSIPALQSSSWVPQRLPGWRVTREPSGHIFPSLYPQEAHGGLRLLA